MNRPTRPFQGPHAKTQKLCHLLRIHYYSNVYEVNDIILHYYRSWWRGTVVERRSLAGELSLSCARPAANG